MTEVNPGKPGPNRVVQTAGPVARRRSRSAARVLWDGILLVASIAVLYVLRGATRHDLDGSIPDAL